MLFPGLVLFSNTDTAMQRSYHSELARPVHMHTHTHTSWRWGPLFELGVAVTIFSQGEKKSLSPFATEWLCLPNFKASPGKKQVHSVTSFFFFFYHLLINSSLWLSPEAADLFLLDRAISRETMICRGQGAACTGVGVEVGKGYGRPRVTE